VEAAGAQGTDVEATVEGTWEIGPEDSLSSWEEGCVCRGGLNVSTSSAQVTVSN
jgi:hypothetical protein